MLLWLLVQQFAKVVLIKEKPKTALGFPWSGHYFFPAGNWGKGIG
jgi:hypothetical protein